MKTQHKISLAISAVIFAISGFINLHANAISVLQPIQGGTGVSSTVAGNIGKCLQVSSSSPFQYTIATCGTTFGTGTSTDVTFWSSATSVTASDYFWFINDALAPSINIFNADNVATTTISGGQIQGLPSLTFVTNGGTIRFANTNLISLNANSTEITDTGTSNSAIFNTASLSANRTFTFPDNSGTFALQTDLTTPTLIPDASATVRGLVNTSTQTFAGNKTFNGTLTTNGISNTGTVTSTNLTDSSVTSSLELADSNGKLTAYGGSSNPCAANQAPTTISATGTLGGCTSTFITSAITSVNNTTNASQIIAAGTGISVSTSSSGGQATTTITLNINAGTQNCGSNTWVSSITSTGTITCTAATTAYWIPWSQTITRTNSTTLSITDASNASSSDSIFSKGTVVKWLDKGTTFMAMAVSATYSSGSSSVQFIGDQFSSNFSSTSTFSYTNDKARTVSFSYAGTIGATGTDLMGHFYAPYDMKIFGADAYTGTAGTTNSTVFAVDQGASPSNPIIASMSISSGATSTSNVAASANPSVNVLSSGGFLSADVSSTQTTAAVDGYINVFTFPNKNKFFQ